MKSRGALALVLGLLLAAPAQAADEYSLDPAHTHVMFKVERFGLSYTFGSFADVEGAVTLDETAPEKSSVIATINTASVDSDNATREEHLRGPYWFNAETYPEISFRSTRVERTGDKTARVTGDLSLHGVTKPVTLDVTLHGSGADPSTQRKGVGFSASGRVNRLDFGMTTAEALIGADVEIIIEALALAPAE